MVLAHRVFTFNICGTKWYLMWLLLYRDYYSSCYCMRSRVQLFVTHGLLALQAPLFMEFSKQEYWSGLPFPPPGNLAHPGTKPESPALAGDSLPLEPPKKPSDYCIPNHHFPNWIKDLYLPDRKSLFHCGDSRNSKSRICSSKCLRVSQSAREEGLLFTGPWSVWCRTTTPLSFPA